MQLRQISFEAQLKTGRHYILMYKSRYFLGSHNDRKGLPGIEYRDGARTVYVSLSQCDAVFELPVIHGLVVDTENAGNLPATAT